MGCYHSEYGKIKNSTWRKFALRVYSVIPFKITKVTEGIFEFILTDDEIVHWRNLQTKKTKKCHPSYKNGITYSWGKEFIIIDLKDEFVNISGWKISMLPINLYKISKKPKIIKTHVFPDVKSQFLSLLIRKRLMAVDLNVLNFEILTTLIYSETITFILESCIFIYQRYTKKSILINIDYLFHLDYDTCIFRSGDEWYIYYCRKVMFKVIKKPFLEDKEIFTVMAKDGKTYRSKGFLESLQSDFVDNQLENGKDIYFPLHNDLEINYNLEFLDYVDSKNKESLILYHNFSQTENFSRQMR